MSMYKIITITVQGFLKLEAFTIELLNQPKCSTTKVLWYMAPHNPIVQDYRNQSAQSGHDLISLVTEFL